MRFSVYQFHLSRVASDAVNELGWSEAKLVHPEVEIQLDVKFEGSENFAPWMFEYYTLVAEMSDIEGLEEVFHVGNGFGDQDKIERVADRMHSLSVGDIVFCHDTNDLLMCDPYGWTAISLKEEAA